MKADWTDAPHYRNKGSPRSQKWLLPFLFGCAITGALVYLGVLDVRLAVPGLTVGKPEPIQKSSEQQKSTEQRESRRTSDQALAEHAAEQTQATFWNNTRQQKQTDFNDSNYVPRGALNTYSPPPAQQVAYNQPATQPAHARTRRTHSANWYWENGPRKNRVAGTFQFVDVDGSIEWGSVCRNYRTGSIEYRDCRKGAKVAFRKMCGSYRPACMAENGFRP